MMIHKFILVSFFIVVSVPNIFAGEIYLKNGDRISGKIIQKTETETIIETQAMGKIVIKNSFIQKEKEVKTEAKKDNNGKKWEKKITIGYSQTNGNTQASQGSSELLVKRKTGQNEWTGALKAFISTSNEKMDAKKFYGMGRYAFSYGDDLKWYNFYKFESEQDQFANIDYRLIPSVGIGYWFSDEEAWKLMFEGAIGFEHTNYRDETKSDNGAILIPRGFLQKKLIGNLKISEDITIYPSLSEGGEYRLHSETALVNPINDQVSWKVSFISDYNSNPSGNTKKNDSRLISSLDYLF